MTDRLAPPPNVPPTPASQAEADRVEQEGQPVAGAETAGAADASQTRDHRFGEAVNVGDGPDAPTPQVEPSPPGGAPPALNGTITPAATSGTDVEVECPGCGLVLVGDSSPRPTAAWFCPRCDYPVFWATPPPDDGSNGQRRARRRLPGTGGLQALGALACWHCGEMNDPGITSCLRCAATLPKPLPPPPEPVWVEVQVPVPMPQVVESATWPFVAATGLAGAAFAIAGTLWLLSIVGL